MYRRDKAPFETNVKNVGVESAFYSAAEVDADELITEAESSFSTLVTMLRSRAPGPVQEPGLGPLLAHLEVRTRHLRQNFAQTAQSLASRVLDAFSDSAFAEAAVRKKLEEDQSSFTAHIKEALRRQGLPALEAQFTQKEITLLQEHGLKEVVGQLPFLLPTIRDGLSTAIEKGSKAGHVSALTKDIAPQKKSDLFSELTYELVQTPPNHLILGDSVVLFHVAADRVFKPSLDGQDKLIAVLLPLDPRTLLVGSYEPYRAKLDRLPWEIARSSLEYFIANGKSALNTRLKQVIGTNSFLVTQSKMNQIASSLDKA